MSAQFAGTERCDPARHDASSFSCGNELLDRQGLSRHFPIPVAILARLAIDSNHHGRGLGAALLNDALARVCRASEQVAVRAVVVHAVDENAAAFYERFGFHALSATPRTLMVTLAELRTAGYA